MTLTTATMNGAWTLQSTNSAQAGRLHDGAFLAGANTGNPMQTWRSGVIASTSSGTTVLDLQVTPSSGLTLAVNAGACVISRSGQGPYTAYVNSAKTVTLAAADATNPRIDLIVAQVNDTVIGDGTTQAILTPVTGTASGSPSAPAVPTGAVVLAQIAVAANASSIVSGNITDKRQCVNVNGGLRRLLPGDLTSTVGYVVGELRDNAGFIERWDGSAWQPHYQTGSGNHLWVATSPNIGISGNSTYYTMAAWGASSISAGIATMASNTNLTLNRQGRWYLKLMQNSNSAISGTIGYAIQWSGGAFGVTALEGTAWRGTGVTDVGKSRTCVEWSGYVTAAQAAASIQAQVYWNPVSSDTLNPVLSLYANYLGG
jgi:hypothetical protein